MATKVVDLSKPASTTQSPMSTESSLNRLLYDPSRWGWSAVGGITDLLTPHERSRRRSTQAAFRQKIRLIKEMAKKGDSTIFNATNGLTETAEISKSEQTSLVTGETVETATQIQPPPSHQPDAQLNIQIQQPQIPGELETQQQQQQQQALQPQTKNESQAQQPQQMETESNVQQPPSEPQEKAEQMQVDIQNQTAPSEPNLDAPQPPIEQNQSSLTSSADPLLLPSSTRPVTPVATVTNPLASAVGSTTRQVESTMSRLAENAAAWGMTLKPLTEDEEYNGEQNHREVEAKVEGYQDGVMDMYSYHRGREGMEPRDAESGELLAVPVPTDTNHNFDAQKLVVTLVVEFPLEDEDGWDSGNAGEDSDIAMFREIVQWDLDDPTTPSPTEFANGVAEEYGLSFGQMMDLASSIQGQIDDHLRQNCNYCVPVAINDPNGNERRYNPEIRQAQPYDYVVRGNGGGVLVSKKRSLKHQQHCPSKPKRQPSITDTVSLASRTSKKGSEKAHSKELVELDEEVEEIYCKEIQKRVLEASKKSISASLVDGKCGLLRQRKDFHCHICHKRCDLAYAFACGSTNHVYCVPHLKNRLGLEIDVETPAYFDHCPVCALSCECSACTRKLQNVAFDFKKQCTEQNAGLCNVIFPHVLEKCQMASTSERRKTFKMIEVPQDASEKANKKSGKGSSKSGDGSGKQSRTNVPKPSLLDFPREVFGAVDMDVGHPNDYMTVYSAEGSFRAFSVPEVWEKEQQRAAEIHKQEKASGSLSQEIVVSSCEEVIEDGNVDYCTVCGKGGNIICCDFCPRTFHQVCMGDDAVSNEDEDGEKWECPTCRKEKEGLPEDLIKGTSYHEKLSTTIGDKLGNDKNGLQVLSIIYEMVSKLMVYDFGVIFQKPVHGEKGYRKIVKHPMDLGTIKTKIESGGYIDAKAESLDAAIIAALNDVELVWHNCFLYNALDSAVYRMAGVLKRRALGIRMRSFDHLLSDAVKSSVSDYLSLCEKDRLQLLLAQKPKNVAETKALQAKQPKGKFKMFVNAKNASAKKVAILDPSTGRIVKTYSSVKNAIVAYSHLEKLGHVSEWTEPDLHKLINRSSTDPKCLIFGYRWLPLDDLRTKKVKFRRKASASAFTVFEMKHGDCLYRFLSIDDALSYLFMLPAIEMSDAKTQLKRVPVGSDFIELFGSGWRRLVFEELNAEKGNGGSEMSADEKRKFLLEDCAVFKVDSCTRKTLVAFKSEQAAFEDWKRTNFASPLSTDLQVADLEHFKKEYLDESLHLGGIVWKRCQKEDSKSNPVEARPAEEEPSLLLPVQVPVGETSTTGMEVDKPNDAEEKVENLDQSRTATPTGDHPTLLGKRKLDTDEEQQGQQMKQLSIDETEVDS